MLKLLKCPCPLLLRNLFLSWVYCLLTNLSNSNYFSPILLEPLCVKVTFPLLVLASRPLYIFFSSVFYLESQWTKFNTFYKHCINNVLTFFLVLLQCFIPPFLFFPFIWFWLQPKWTIYMFLFNLYILSDKFYNKTFTQLSIQSVIQYIFMYLPSWRQRPQITAWSILTGLGGWWEGMGWAVKKTFSRGFTGV